MTIPSHRCRPTPLAAAGLFLLGAFVFLAGAALLAPNKPAVIASVDLERVYDGLHQQAAADAALEALAAEMNTVVEQRRRELEDLDAELANFTPGSAPHKAATQKLELALLQYNGLVEFNRSKLEARRADYIRSIYAQVKATLKILAQENGWDIVFLDDSVADIEVSDANRTMQQISARRMLYSNAGLDVTEMLIARMNADHASAKGS